MKKVISILCLIAVVAICMVSCNRPEPQYEGVLMQNYGRNGIEDFKTVTGAQGILWFGEELYEIPMWEQDGNPKRVRISTKDQTPFYVDPSYTYSPIRLKGANIVLSYKNYNISEPETFFSSIEKNILDRRVVDAYREEARKFTTDSLMNNMAQFEENVESKLRDVFKTKYFALGTLTSGLTPSDKMLDAIEARNVSLQKANTIRNELENSKLLLEKAKIDAEANRVKSSGLTKEVLSDRWINAIKYTKNKVIITDGNTPIILNK